LNFSTNYALKWQVIALNKYTLKKAVLPGELALCRQLLPLAQACGRADEDLESLHILECGESEAGFDRLAFRGVLFEKCALLSCSLQNALFQDVRFLGCDLSGSSFSGSRFVRCEFLNTKCCGSNFSSGSFLSVKFEDCLLRYANFTSSKLESSAFENSDLTDVFLAQCKLKNLSLDRSRFVRTDFFQTPLKGLDFSNATLEGICVSEGAGELAGATVSPLQAVELARLLGVIVQE